MQTENKKETKKINFFVGKEKFETEEVSLTVNEILIDFVKVNPTEKSLVLKKGNETHEYLNIEEGILMNEGMHFVLFDKTPTNVSQ